jgi:hypothetical protein
MFDFNKNGMSLLEVVKAYPEEVVKAIEEMMHLRKIGENEQVPAKQYDIVKAFERSTITNQVTIKLNDGWVLAGNLIVIDNGVYYQPMTKDNV